MTLTQPTLRPYQTEAEQAIYDAWAQNLLNVLLRMPTGAGKTVLLASILKKHKGAACAIAHRQELVSQISLALGQVGVWHNIIASASTVKFISQYHIKMLGRSFFHPQAPIAVAGVDTLKNRDLGQWGQQVTLWIQDEAHHVLKTNKWGKAVEKFPYAKGLGLTATPGRADGRGLGRHSDGLFDFMVEGPSMRDLINWGNLTDYRIFAPANDLDLYNVDISKQTGDFNPNQLRTACHKSKIVGNIVENYCKIAGGKLGVTFAVDVEQATDIAKQYNDVGIPAAIVSAKTPDRLRIELVERFRRRELLQLVNVDLFGEGFDLPAIEVVSMGRPTHSNPLFTQQFGRALRPLEGKDYAIIIDHVGNCATQGGAPGRHPLPDAPRTWSLDARERGSRGKVDETVIPITACTACMRAYERVLPACPFCGHKPEPQGRGTPEQVDGDLIELTPEALAALRGQVAEAIETPDDVKKRLEGYGMAKVVINTRVKLKREQLEALNPLRESINWWNYSTKTPEMSESEMYRRFFHKFGVDVLTAQTLNRKDTEELTRKIQDDYNS